MTELTESTLATIYGCCALFDICADDAVLSLTKAGASPFLDWLGWRSSDMCVVHREFISWMRPEQTGTACTAGYLADPCADPNGVEYGTCDYRYEDFGRVRREGPVRDITENDQRYCEKQPRYRLDGSVVNNDREHDALVINDVLLQDVHRLTVTGNQTTGGQWDGLQRLVRTGYTNSSGRRCTSMDSYVVDWNSNAMSGGNGITVNGGAIANTWDLIDVLRSIYTRIRQRISWSPTLAAQQMQVGDMIILLPSFMIECLLDFFTCWSVCDRDTLDHTDTNIQIQLQTFEARQFRNQLMGGMFGHGRIFLHGFEIPLLGYDWELITGPTRGDMYLLTGQIGNVKTMHYEYLNMDGVQRSGYPEASTRFMSSDGGKFLHWAKYDHTCVVNHQEIRPRIISWAPWANARFQNVRCTSPTDPLSPDPCDTSFFPEKSFSVAECA